MIDEVELATRRGRFARSFRSGVRLTTTFAAAASTCVVMVGCGGVKSASGCRLRSVDKVSYVAANEEVFRQIPVFPGSKLLNSYSIGNPASNRCLPTENGPPYDSFATTRWYSRPKATPTGAIVRSYRERLVPAWQLRGYSATTPPRDSAFRRGAAMVYISETDRGWELNVDHAAYRFPKP
jgi:hypothetical protein